LPDHPHKFLKQEFKKIEAVFILQKDYYLYSNLKQIVSMAFGTVKFFNDSKGYGFIKPEDGGEDLFVHVSGLKDDIRENDRVSYEVERGKKGLNAVNVQRER
jgi:CspA family cold shock protein